MAEVPAPDKAPLHSLRSYARAKGIAEDLAVKVYEQAIAIGKNALPPAFVAHQFKKPSGWPDTRAVVVKKRREISLMAPDSPCGLFSTAMKTDAAFRLLTHEEFTKLPTEEKFAYLARATVSTPSESPPSQARRKPRPTRSAPKARRVGPLAERGVAGSGSE
jgi:hypothetical protein